MNHHKNWKGEEPQQYRLQSKWELGECDSIVWVHPTIHTYDTKSIYSIRQRQLSPGTQLLNSVHVK